MASMQYTESSYKREDDPLVRIIKDLMDRVSALEVRIRELEYEKSPTNVRLS
jgi:hypothetical protein